MQEIDRADLGSLIHGHVGFTIDADSPFDLSFVFEEAAQNISSLL